MKAGIALSISVALSLILVLLLTGCSEKRTLAGMWKGDRDWKSLGIESEAAARARAAVNLELKPSGEFILTDGGEPFTGTWVQSPTKVDLYPETYMNKPMDRMMKEARDRLVFSVRVDGERLFFMNYIGEKEFELKKEAKPK